MKPVYPPKCNYNPYFLVNQTVKVSCECKGELCNGSQSVSKLFVFYGIVATFVAVVFQLRWRMPVVTKRVVVIVENNLVFQNLYLSLS